MRTLNNISYGWDLRPVHTTLFLNLKLLSWRLVCKVDSIPLRLFPGLLKTTTVWARIYLEKHEWGKIAHLTRKASKKCWTSDRCPSILRSTVPNLTKRSGYRNRWLPVKRILFVERTLSDFETKTNGYSIITRWAQVRNLIGAETEYIGLLRDYPAITPINKCHFCTGITLKMKSGQMERSYMLKSNPEPTRHFPFMVMLINSHNLSPGSSTVGFPIVGLRSNMVLPSLYFSKILPGIS